jgi:hypothetical protein
MPLHAGHPVAVVDIDMLPATGPDDLVDHPSAVDEREHAVQRSVDGGGCLEQERLHPYSLAAASSGTGSTGASTFFSDRTNPIPTRMSRPPSPCSSDRFSPSSSHA